MYTLYVDNVLAQNAPLHEMEWVPSLPPSSFMYNVSCTGTVHIESKRVVVLKCLVSPSGYTLSA